MGYSLSVFFCYGALFSWIAIGPVLLIKRVGLSPVEFGWTSFVIAAGAMSLAGLVNGRIIKRVGGQFMLRMGWLIMFASGVLMLTWYLLAGVSGLAIIAPVFLFIFGVTFIWPNAFAGAFTPFGTIAGYAGSLYSFMQLGGGALIGNSVAWLPSNSPLPLAIILVVSPLLAWLSYEVLVIQSLNNRSV